MPMPSRPVPVMSRRAFLGTLALAAVAQTSVGRALAAPMPVISRILGRPTARSIALSLLTSETIDAHVEYGYSTSVGGARTATLRVPRGEPTVIELSRLRPDSRVYYRVRYTTPEGASRASSISSFTTQRAAGTPFSFTVQGDSHPERAGRMFDASLYAQTQANVASHSPDFHVLIGDDFSIDPLIERGQADQPHVEAVYRQQRPWLDRSARSAPLFLVNGNHEQAAAYLLDGTPTSPAVLAANARAKYFPVPAVGGFYTGDASQVPNIGRLNSYYAFTWGDALIITLDPYWHSPIAVDNTAGAKGEGGKGGGDLWQVTIGDAQYAWLKRTLESSRAKYVFVFAHHVMGTGRGGVELASDYEWGGRDPKGKSTFAAQRPTWELPIHQLMAKHRVSVFFQGHDHIFVHQELDGVVYQTLPNPADPTFSMLNENAYRSGVTAPNTGHVRVSVGPSRATVEYFLSARPQDESASRRNLAIAHSYSVKPRR
jgi:hypothetical protein